MLEADAATDSEEVGGSTGAELTSKESVVLENLFGHDFNDWTPRLAFPHFEDCDHVMKIDEVLNTDCGPHTGAMRYFVRHL